MVAYSSTNRISRHWKSTDNVNTGAGKPKIVYIEKDQYPISIIQLHQVSDIEWRKKSGCDFLTCLVNSFSCGYNVFGLITYVENEVLMDKYSAL